MKTAHRLTFVLGLAAVAAVLVIRPWHSARTGTDVPLARLSCDLPDDKSSPHPGMVWVPPGEFDMGDTVYREEGPLQRTRVGGFWMDRTEVSNAEFARFVAATGYVTVAERPVDTVRHPDLKGPLLQAGAVVFVMPENVQNGGDIRQWWTYRPGANWRHPGGPGTTLEGLDALPVVAVTYEDAQAYARWKGRELPTEAQWEWAARGGEPVQSGQIHPPVQANTWQGVFPVNNPAQDGFVGVAPVGCFAPNRYGLFDMIGNVWEITRDPYVPFHDARDNLPPDQEVLPTRPGPAFSQHVIKGGSFLCAPNYCMRYRSGARQGQEDDLATSHLGFRTVLRAPAP
jgi:formylglycine-generating enzyme required for sulfatase activity